MLCAVLHRAHQCLTEEQWLLPRAPTAETSALASTNSHCSLLITSSSSVSRRAIICSYLCMIFTVLCMFVLRRSLVSRKIPNTSFVIQNELRSLVPELPADTNNVKPLTSAGRRPRLSRQQEHELKRQRHLTIPTAIHVLGRFQRALLSCFKSWLHFCLSECIC